MNEQDDLRLKKLTNYVNQLVEDHSKLEQRMLSISNDFNERLEAVVRKIDDLEYASDNEICMCDVPIERDGVPAKEE
jgi:hypothetical protein